MAGLLIKDYSEYLNLIPKLNNDELNKFNLFINKKDNFYDQNINLITACDAAINFGSNKNYDVKALNVFYNYINDFIINQYYFYIFIQTISILYRVDLISNITDIFPNINIEELNEIEDDNDKLIYIRNYMINDYKNNSLTYLYTYMDKIKNIILLLAHFVKNVKSNPIRTDDGNIFLNISFDITLEKMIKTFGIFETNGVLYKYGEHKIDVEDTDTQLNMNTQFNSMFGEIISNDIINKLVESTIYTDEDGNPAYDIENILFIPLLYNVPIYFGRTYITFMFQSIKIKDLLIFDK